MRIRIVAALLTLLVAGLPVAADTLITTKVHNEGLPAVGREAEEVTKTTWLGKDKLREDDSNRSLILDLESQAMYIVNHETKTFHKLALPIDFASYVSEEMTPMLEQMMTYMKVEVSITPTDETRVIGDYPTKKYDIKITNTAGIEIEQKLWMTDAIDIDASAYRKMALEMASIKPSMREIFGKLMEIEGYPVLQETTTRVMGNELSSREELISIVEQEAPAGTYAPPSDYEQRPFDPLAALRQR